ncbi:hypothetical protein KKC60_01635, partial [Patescibacteria group bacterium]|nr:hypothetical protein [Patescibacteria group bacterium]
MKKQNIQFVILSVTLTLVAAVVVLTNIETQAAFQEPTGAPPTGNVPAPINVGTDSQYKQGYLAVGANAQPVQAALEGHATVPDKYGIYGVSSGDSYPGIVGESTNNNPGELSLGVQGKGKTIGVYGGGDEAGVYGVSSVDYGVRGSSTANYAGYFEGIGGVTGIATSGFGNGGFFASQGTGALALTTTPGSDANNYTYGLEGRAAPKSGAAGSFSAGVYGSSDDFRGVIGESAAGQGVYGEGGSQGVYGKSANTGVWGEVTDWNNARFGVVGRAYVDNNKNSAGSLGGHDTAVWGYYKDPTTPNAVAVKGEADVSVGNAKQGGVYGFSKNGYGVYGKANWNGSIAVVPAGGPPTSTSNPPTEPDYSGGAGIVGLGDSYGVIANGGYWGGKFEASQDEGVGLQSVGPTYGTYATATNDSGAGVYGVGYGGNNQYGIKGKANFNGGIGVYGEGRQYGVSGQSDNVGVYGKGGTYGVHGHSDNSYGIYGSSTATGYAGYFMGDVYVKPASSYGMMVAGNLRVSGQTTVEALTANGDFYNNNAVMGYIHGDGGAVKIHSDSILYVENAAVVANDLQVNNNNWGVAGQSGYFTNDGNDHNCPSGYFVKGMNVASDWSMNLLC